MAASYKVLKKCFLNGKTYSPTHKRRSVYHRPTAFKNGECPSFLEPIKAETAAAKKKRVAAEKKLHEEVAESKAETALTFDTEPTATTEAI